jgi:hypothetical protein
VQLFYYLKKIKNPLPSTGFKNSGGLDLLAILSSFFFRKKSNSRKSELKIIHPTLKLRRGKREGKFLLQEA